jgi:short-subunit dehydrogenase
MSPEKSDKNEKGYVLITGASEGLGREFAKLFARENYPLILTARNRERLNQIAGELTSSHGANVKTFAKDLSLPSGADELKAEIDRHGLEVETLINNAGSGVHGFFHETDWKTTEAMLTLNILALTRLTRLFLPPMISKGRGKILNVASTAAFQPGPLMACYFASKAYVLSLTEALANELSGTGVTVSTFCPGPTRTQFQKRSGTETIRENSFAMDADTAARIAYRELAKGKTRIIPGLLNRLLAGLVRFFPRKLVLAATRYLEEKSG